jgi:5-methyltetrahydrofolate--homocysteine methyltransferase
VREIAAPSERRRGFLERLRSGAPLLLDGGLGTELIARGLPTGAPPESWTLERAEVVAAVHAAYVAAGSEAIHTNTFGANAIRLARYGLAERAAELNRIGVRLARESGASWVIGDVGPAGDYLPPVGSADPSAWRKAFADQARDLAEAGVDAFHVETMSDLREALVALEAIRAAAPGVAVMTSMTFERKKRGFFTVMGNALSASLQSLAAAGAGAVGANCSIASGDMRALAEEALAAVRAPLVLQPNAGAPRMAGRSFVYDQSPEDFAADMARVAALGVRAIGGCCGTDPRFIAALRQQRLAEARTS